MVELDHMNKTNFEMKFRKYLS